MANRRFNRGRSFPPRQTQRDWARSVSTAQFAVAAGAKVLIVGFADADHDVTLRRSIGELFVVSDQSAATEVQAGAIGAVVVSDIAFAAGVASIPGPVTDRNADFWAMWMPFVMQSAGMTPGDQGIESLNRFFDSAGQRKVPQGSTIAFVIENASGVNGFNALFAVSVLVSH